MDEGMGVYVKRKLTVCGNILAKWAK